MELIVGWSFVALERNRMQNPRTATGYQEHYRLRKLFLERRAREIRSERGDVDEVETEE